MAAPPPGYSHITATAEYHNIQVGDNAQVHNGPIFGNVTYGHAPNEVDEMRKALFETDPEITRQDLMQSKGERVPGTCAWITQDAAYQSWIRGEIAVLVINGGPGKGKTMLADFIISDLEHKVTPGIALAYFFCLNGDAKQNNMVSVLRGLLYHLLRTNPHLSTSLRPHLGSSERQTSVLSSADTLWSMLLTIVNAIGTVFCVLDGLDECNRDAYLFLTKKLAGQKAATTQVPGLRVVILSRPFGAFHTFTRIRLDPDNDEQIGQDIKAYITDKLIELDTVVPLGEAFSQELSKELAKRAEGTFLWIGFAISELMRQDTRTSIKACLSGMPSGLPAFYEHMLRQISERHKSSCLTILKWAAAALRPLRTWEMAAVLYPDLRGPPSDQLLSQVDDLIKECGSIVVARRRGLMRAVTSTHEILLVHQSARDYLLSAKVNNDASTQYDRLDSVSASVELLMACVTCIESPKALSSPLYLYAEEELASHAKLVPESHQYVFGASFFFADQNRARDILWNPLRYRETPKHSQFILATRLGILPWLKYLLSNYGTRVPDIVDATHHTYGTLLSLAIETENAEIVHSLLEHGASVHHASLRQAVVRRWTPVVHALVEGGARAHRDLLHSAVQGKSKRSVSSKPIELDEVSDGIIEYLLSSGCRAHVDARDIDGYPPLIRAAQARSLVDVRSLIKGGADVNKGNNVGATALHFASEEGHHEIVRCLLNSGARVDSLDSLGRTALHVTLSYDPYPLEDDEKKVWHRATRRGILATTRLLLEHGADPQALDKSGRMPLDDWPDKQLLWHRGDNSGIFRKYAKVATESMWISTCISIYSDAYQRPAELLAAHGRDLHARSSTGDCLASLYATGKDKLQTVLPAYYRASRYDHEGNRLWPKRKCGHCQRDRMALHRCFDCSEFWICMFCIVTHHEEHAGHVMGFSNYHEDVMRDDEGWWSYVCTACDKQIYGVALVCYWDPHIGPEVDCGSNPKRKSRISWSCEHHNSMYYRQFCETCDTKAKADNPDCEFRRYDSVEEAARLLGQLL